MRARVPCGCGSPALLCGCVAHSVAECLHVLQTPLVTFYAMQEELRDRAVLLGEVGDARERESLRARASGGESGRGGAIDIDR